MSAMAVVSAASAKAKAVLAAVAAAAHARRASASRLVHEGTMLLRKLACAALPLMPVRAVGCSG